MFDLTVPDDVVDYLQQLAPFASTSAVSLAGGHANFSYRATLRTPYAAPGLDALVHTIIMKHAEPYMALIKNMPFAVERQEFECLALNTISKIVALPPLTSIPMLFYEDRLNRVMLMSDSGPGCLTLCDILKKGPLRDSIAHDLGAELGTFIARLHMASRNPAPGTLAHNTKSEFSKNQQGIMVANDVFYASIMPTLTADQPLLSPPLELSPTILSRLDATVRKTQARIKTSTDVIVMGDFRSGNFLVVFEPALHVTIVDWEVARTGFPGIDLGTFLGELLLIRVFQPASRRCIDLIVETFAKMYRQIMLENRTRADVERRLAWIARDAATHIGAYVITLAPRMPWGGPGPTRAVVQEGVEYILHAIDRDDAWLRRSMVGALWG